MNSLQNFFARLIRCITNRLTRRALAKESHQVILYSRQGCHLCDEAYEVLKRHDLDITLIDIDTDQALYQRYRNCIPVVTIDGKERFRGSVNEILLRRLL